MGCKSVVYPPSPPPGPCIMYSGGFNRQGHFASQNKAGQHRQLEIANEKKSTLDLFVCFFLNENKTERRAAHTVQPLKRVLQFVS